MKVPELALRLCVIPLAVASLWEMATNSQADDTYGAVKFSNISGFTCLRSSLHLAVAHQVIRSVRLAHSRPGSGIGVPACDVGFGGGGGAAAGAARRPGRVVGRGVLLLRPLLQQGHRLPGAARRRARLLRRPFPPLRLQGLQQVPSSPLRRRRLLRRARAQARARTKGSSLVMCVDSCRMSGSGDVCAPMWTLIN
ncbi:unnamed protein product [Urochloa humidicola]